MTKRRAITVPPKEVLTAFGTCLSPERLPGGQGQAFRSGNCILKPAVDDERTNWIAEFHDMASLDGFRLPKPIKASDGSFVFEGWQAWRAVEGQHRMENWEGVVDLCIRFHNAISAVPRPGWLDRTGDIDPWSVADRACWGEMEWDPHPSIEPVVSELRGCLRQIDVSSQLIHGDFGGNVLFDEALPPAVIDLSLYWRPAGFAVGVVVADAIVWQGADSSLIDAVEAVPSFDQLLARAELRRLLELDAAHRMWQWDTLKEVDVHLPLVRAIVERCAR